MEAATIDRSKEWTIKDYLQLEEGLLAQLIDGKLIMSPSPTTKHQQIVANLLILLRQLTGNTFIAPLDLYINDKNVFQPDLMYIAEDRKAIISENGIKGVPNLIIEVISPSNSYLDHNIKRKKYLDFGVSEYWIVDPGNETLEIYTPIDYETPILYLIQEGKITSTVSSDINFDLQQVFDF